MVHKLMAAQKLLNLHKLSSHHLERCINMWKSWRYACFMLLRPFSLLLNRFILFFMVCTKIWCVVTSNWLWTQDFMALLAYEEPEKSPMFHLLSLEYRQSVAENLNRAILGMLLFNMADWLKHYNFHSKHLLVYYQESFFIKYAKKTPIVFSPTLTKKFHRLCKSGAESRRKGLHFSWTRILLGTLLPLHMTVSC